MCRLTNSGGRMRVLRRTIGLSLLAVVVMAGLAPPASASPRGVFVSHCAYSHSLPDDPIVHPGEPGASHLHDFFGNTTTSATSTVEEMVHATTTCRFDRDTAGYWFPAGELAGVPLVPTFSKTYYFGVAGRVVERIPRGMQLIAGDPEAASAAGNPRVSWSCGAKGHRRTPISDHPYDCTRFADRWAFVDGVVARVTFPSCWNGAGRAPADLTYVVDGVCPDGYERRLPTIGMQVHFGILDPCVPGASCRSEGTDDNVSLSLSSGPYFTFHADLWNTWHQGSLNHLTARCLDEHIRCGVVSNS